MTCYILSVNCEWSNWSSFSSCSKSCGGGTQFQSRSKVTEEANGGTCTYNCKSNGGCEVYFQANGLYSGASKGSCFPKSFGGECIGTPRFCEKCIIKCQGKGFGSFDEEVWRIIRILSTICISEKMSLMKFEWNEVMHF